MILFPVKKEKRAKPRSSTRNKAVTSSLSELHVNTKAVDWLRFFLLEAQHIRERDLLRRVLGLSITTLTHTPSYCLSSSRPFSCRRRHQLINEKDTGALFD